MDETPELRLRGLLLLAAPQGGERQKQPQLGAPKTGAPGWATDRSAAWPEEKQKPRPGQQRAGTGHLCARVGHAQRIASAALFARPAAGRAGRIRRHRGKFAQQRAHENVGGGQRGAGVLHGGEQAAASGVHEANGVEIDVHGALLGRQRKPGAAELGNAGADQLAFEAKGDPSAIIVNREAKHDRFSGAGGRGGRPSPVR